MGEIKRAIIFLLIGLCPGCGMIFRGSHLKEIHPVITGEDLLGTEGHYMEDSLQQTTGWILFIIGILWVVCAVIGLIISLIVAPPEQKIDEKDSKTVQSHVLVEKRQKKQKRNKKLRESEKKDNVSSKEKNVSRPKSKRIVYIVGAFIIIVLSATVVFMVSGNDSSNEGNDYTRLSAEEASAIVASQYTSIDNSGKIETCSFDDQGEMGYVSMTRYDENGEIEYNSGFYYGITRFDDGQIEIDFAYPKKQLFTDNYGEYLVTGTDGSKITEFNSINDWEWSGTYEINDQSTSEATDTTEDTEQQLLIPEARELPFKVGDSYKTARDALEEKGLDFEYGSSAVDGYESGEWCSGWFDYFGTDDKQSQKISIVSPRYDSDNELGSIMWIEITMLPEYADKAIEKLTKVYDISDNEIIANDDNTRITMKKEDVEIEVHKDDAFEKNAAYHSGEDAVYIYIH